MAKVADESSELVSAAEKWLGKHADGGSSLTEVVAKYRKSLETLTSSKLRLDAAKAESKAIAKELKKTLKEVKTAEKAVKVARTPKTADERTGASTEVKSTAATSSSAKPAKASPARAQEATAPAQASQENSSVGKGEGSRGKVRSTAGTDKGTRT